MKQVWWVLALTLTLALEVMSMGFGQKSGGNKIDIKIYYETKCPASIEFFSLGTIRRLVGIKNIQDIVELNIYPFGNGDTWLKTVNGQQIYQFVCQNGPSECEGNLIHSCALKHYDKLTQVLPFISCIMSKKNWSVDLAKCASYYQIDTNVIRNCTASKQGNSFQNGVAMSTKAANIPYTPAIYIDGVLTPKAYSNILRYVCSIYKGSRKLPVECFPYMNGGNSLINSSATAKSDQPPMIIGGGYSGQLEQNQ